VRCDVRIRLLVPAAYLLSIVGFQGGALAAGSVTGVSAVPSPAAAGSEVAITLAGTGPCQVYLDFGDKQKAAHLKLLPGTVKHAYARPGTYVIRTFTYTSGNEPPGLSRCGGFADMELVVNPAGRSKVFAPGGSAAGTGAAAPAQDRKIQTVGVLPADKPTSTPDSSQLKGSSGAIQGVGGVANPVPAAGGAAAGNTLRARSGTPTPTPRPQK
jgi:hypothetical protein